MAAGSVEVTPGVPSARILIVDCGPRTPRVSQAPTTHTIPLPPISNRTKTHRGIIFRVLARALPLNSYVRFSAAGAHSSAMRLSTSASGAV